MKQLLSLALALLPCLALAQYPSNANQKITLGEQTTADGLVFRGVVADTTLTVKSDTAAYFVLDTVNLNLYTYKASASGRKWRQLGADTAAIAYVNTYGTQTVNGAKTFTSAVTATRFNPTANTETGTGMFLPAANTLGFSTNGTEKVRITSGGNVLVGTTSDVGYKMYIRGNLYVSTNSAGTLCNFTDGINQSFQINTTTTGFDITNPNSGYISFSNTAEGMRITSSGNVGIGTTSPTARLHLAAGTATASTAPLKFTSGTNLTTAEAGAMEFNGTNLFFSPSTTRHTVNHGLTGSATLDFPSTTTLLSADLTITVTGAADGDVVSLGVPNAAVNANTCYTAWVSATNTVTVRFNNYSSGTVNPASGTFKVFVTK